MSVVKLALALSPIYPNFLIQSHGYKYHPSRRLLIITSSSLSFFM